MPAPKVRFLPAGDTALVIEFGSSIDHAISDRVLGLKARLEASKPAGVIELVATFRSLMVHYDPLRTSNVQLIGAVENLLQDSRSVRREARLWRIPACYDSGHSPDLPEVARRTGLSEDEVIELHSGTRYHVYMIGFVPGYPYMGDLPPPLHLPRRSDPRVRVPAGSVAIAAGMTAIYPVESPGGWHLIASTPVRLFHPSAEPPALLRPGDAVRFERVSSIELDKLRRRVNAGDWQVPCEAMQA